MENYTLVNILLWYLGSCDNLLKVFTLIVIVGIITMAMSSIAKNNNLEYLTLMLFTQKITEYIIIGIGNVLDLYITSGERSFRKLIITFYLIYEVLKILDNAAKMGLPLPHKVRKFLEYIFNNVDNQDNKKQ